MRDMSRLSADRRIRFATVAVCTRNRSDVLDECLITLQRQNFPRDRYEIVVIDDGSTDETPRIVDRLADGSSVPLRKVVQSYSGLSNARNRAINESRGDLICFLDDDAVASTGWLAAMVAGADRYPNAEAFAGRLLQRIEGKAPRMCGREKLAAELDEGTAERTTSIAKGANMAMRRSAFERIGLFKPGLVWRGDEEDWHARLFAEGGSMMYLPEALAWHRRTAVDLEPLRLLRTRFGWGVARVQSMRESGVAVDVRQELAKLRAHMKHAVRERCFGGIMHASMRVGTLWAMLRGEARKKRSVAPELAQAPGMRPPADRSA